MLGGPVMNLVIATVLYLILFSGIGVMTSTTTIGYVAECVKPVTSTEQTCAASDAPSPAAAAGLTPGDTVISVAGKLVTTWDSGTAVIRDRAGKPTDFVVERDGVQRTVSITPIATERYKIDDAGNLVLDANDQPIVVTVGYVGIGPEAVREAQSPSVALTAVGDNIVGVGHIILDLPNRMTQVWNAAFGTDARDPNGPVSVVGVGRIAGEVASIDGIDFVSRISALLGILASLNIALFVFNLIPLLPLDGGHVAVALIDWVRTTVARLLGRPAPAPIDTARLVPITVVATAILIAMSALLIYADIVKPITLGP